MDYLKTKPANGVQLWIAVIITWLPLPFMIFFDIFITEFYHRTTFFLVNIKYIKRSDYIQIVDRNKLQYLNWPQKIGCMYCGYINGLMAYSKAIANRSEKHWCGIIHENIQELKGQEYQEEMGFAKFGDEKEFKEKYTKEK